MTRLLRRLCLACLVLAPLAGCKTLKGETGPRPAVYDDPGGGM